MAVLQRATLKDQIYDVIRERIQDNSYKSGERINIDNIARELHVSNSPVREAVNMLIKDGLLETTTNAGPRVIVPTPDEIDDLNQAIYILLAGGYDICCSKGLQEDLLNALEARYQQQKKVSKKALVNSISAAILFDRAFLDVTRNNRLINMYDALANVFFLVVSERHRKEEISAWNSLDDHEKIIEAVRTGGRAGVMKELSHHYQQA